MSPLIITLTVALVNHLGGEEDLVGILFKEKLYCLKQVNLKEKVTLQVVWLHAHHWD